MKKKVDPTIIESTFNKDNERVLLIFILIHGNSPCSL